MKINNLFLLKWSLWLVVKCLPSIFPRFTSWEGSYSKLIGGSDEIRVKCTECDYVALRVTSSKVYTCFLTTIEYLNSSNRHRIVMRCSCCNKILNSGSLHKITGVQLDLWQ